MAMTPDKSAAPAAPPAPKTITCEVVTNYGRHLVGAVIDVPEEHYLKLRRPDGEGGFTFPVLISLADKEALQAKQRAAEEAKQRAARTADPDRATSAGWAEHRRKSEEIVRANVVKQQREQHALVIGDQDAPDPAEVQRVFTERMKGARGG